VIQDMMYLTARLTQHAGSCGSALGRENPWRFAWQSQGLPRERDTVERERDNIVIRLDGDGHGLMVWEVHQDTVPVEGMSIDHFGGGLRKGRVWGRGVCDIKGGMAAMISALV